MNERNRMIRKLLLSLLFFLMIIDVVSQNKYETRGVWIATVKNIDWPKSAGDPAAKQEAELIKLIDDLYQKNINTIIFQVRPAADAFYKSSFEPWSEWLTGQQGKAPAGFFDPLQTAIDEAHKRGMQLHAWINPYRLVSNRLTSQISEQHVVKHHPEWTVEYGNDIYANPGLPEVREYIAKIVADIVKNYDVDAIHMDDYFYPYPIQNVIFNDSAAFRQYGGEYYPNQLKEWRIQNVNLTVKVISETIKAVKPYVQFGIAPFGIWRNASQDPKGSATNGLANYDHLYADVLYWMEQKWIDYLSPQIYWPINYSPASYQVLVEWWNKNYQNIKLYTGHAYYMADAESKNPQWKNPAEIPNQISLSRKMDKFGGFIFYNTTSFFRNNMGLTDSLHQKELMHKSLPNVPQIYANQAPSKPIGLVTQKRGKEMFVFWESENQENQDSASFYAIYMTKGAVTGNLNKPEFLKDMVNTKIYTIPVKRFALFPEKYTLAVSALNRFYTESESTEKVVLKIKIKK